MHELNLLKQIVEQFLFPAGYVLDAEAYHPDVFGSYFSIYANDVHQIRFVWDGKEGLGFLQNRLDSEDTWQSFSAAVPESKKEEMCELAKRLWQEDLAPFIT